MSLGLKSVLLTITYAIFDILVLFLGQPPTSCYTYGGPSAASAATLPPAAPTLKSNMYALRPSSSTVAPNR